LQVFLRRHLRLGAALDAVQKAGVKNMVAFNYRFAPALVQAKKLIDSGALGRIFHFRAQYLQEWIIDPNFERVWRLDKSVAGSGALGDLGSHIIDLARFLVGEPKRVMAMTKTFIPERPLPGGGGMGKVTMNGRHEASRVTLDPAVPLDDREMLEDLVAAAINDATQRIETATQQKMSGVMGGMQLPPGMKLPFGG
jgi:DNA-binding YbaB/EbfC family protein